MSNSRREFNKLIMLSASVLPTVAASASHSHKNTEKSLAREQWSKISDISPHQYLASRGERKESLKHQIINQFNDGYTARLGGLTISYIELATIAVLEDINKN